LTNGLPLVISSGGLEGALPKIVMWSMMAGRKLINGVRNKQGWNFGAE